MFAVRIVTADYYLESPVKGLDVCYSEFRESDVKKVPVVRIFGATPAGRSALHTVVVEDTRGARAVDHATARVLWGDTVKHPAGSGWDWEFSAPSRQPVARAQGPPLCFKPYILYICSTQVCENIKNRLTQIVSFL